MTCPVCGGDTTVNCTRKETDAIYRRRKCRICDHIFYTCEEETSGSDDFYRLDDLAVARSKRRKVVERGLIV